MESYEYVLQAVNFIEQNIIEQNIEEDRLYISSICDYVHYRESQLEKVFYRYVGKSIYKYILHRKLTLIAEELRETNERITDIAIKYNVGNINRAFKKHFGVSPGEYRKTGYLKREKCERFELSIQQMESEDLLMNEDDIFQIDAEEDINWRLRYLFNELDINFMESDSYTSWVKLFSFINLSPKKLYKYSNTRLYQNSEIFNCIYDSLQNLDNNAKQYARDCDWITPIAIIIDEFYADNYTEILKEIICLYQDRRNQSLDKTFIEIIKNRNIKTKSY